MPDYTSTILATEFVTHDVKAFYIGKPPGFSFTPGNAVRLAIDTPQLREERRPFSPVSLNEDELVQFIIKRYPAHHGVTDKLHSLKPGGRVVFSDASGAIEFRGPGVFIAAGAGLTPFLSILRRLARDGRLAGNTLILSNKLHEDILCERELRAYLGDRCTFTLTRESRPGYESRRIDQAFLAERVANFAQPFYICGPARFTSDVSKALAALGAEPTQLVFD